MESHKAIIPCERCENSRKLHQIKTHLMTTLIICCRNTYMSENLVIRCRNTCVSENLCVFFLTKCRIHVNYQNSNSFFLSCSTGLII